MPSDTRARSILQRHLSVFLQHRMVRLNGAHPLLPTYLQNMVAQYHDTSPGAALDLHDSRRILCDFLVEHCPTALALTLHTPGVLPFHRGNNTAVAAAIGSVQSMCTARSHSPNLLWDQAPAFGYPLVIAVAANNTATVLAIVKDFEKRAYEKPILCYLPCFYAAIDTALDRRHVALFEVLVQTLAEYKVAPPNAQITTWVQRAYHTMDARYIDAALTLRSAESLAPITMTFEAACRTGNVRLAEIMLEREDLDINTFDGRAMSPIVAAVRGGHVSVVDEVLRRGANPDGSPPLRPAERPLWLALARNDMPMVQSLLRSGADGRLIRPMWNAETDDFRAPRTTTFKHIRDAMRHEDLYSKRIVVPRLRIAMHAGDA